MVGTDHIRTLEDKKRAVADRVGPWTAHNVYLGEAVYTRGPRIFGDEHRVRRVVQAVVDLMPTPFKKLRVLDLGCLEGLYAIEFAARGAEVVGIEGRRTNIERARFAQQILGLDSVEFVLDDVRNLSRERYGEFDVVLCVGILYHLDAPAVFEFIDRVGEVCTRLAVVDTHVALTGRELRSYGGREYRGISFVEHSAAAPRAVKERSEWASLDNPVSFWLTRASLLNALTSVGFTTISECGVPALPTEPPDRITLLALKGRSQGLVSSPLIGETTPIPAVAEERSGSLLNQSSAFLLAKRVVLGIQAHWYRLVRRP